MEHEMKNNKFFVQSILSKLRPQIDMVDDECLYTILRFIKSAQFCGWSDEDIVSFCRCMEEINPQLSENVALERMKAIHNKYLNSSNRDTIDSITIDGIIDDNSKGTDV